MKKLGVEYYDGEKRTYFADGEGGLVIQAEQNLTPIIELNKAQYNQTDERAKWGEWAKIASLPNSVVADLNASGVMKGHAITDLKRFKAWLNNSDNKFFRTRPGQV